MLFRSAAPVAEEAEPQVEEIEEKVLAAFAAQSVEEKVEEEAEEPVQDVIAEEKDNYPAGDPFADSLESTRRINLADLKFGRNYTGEED